MSKNKLPELVKPIKPIEPDIKNYKNDYKLGSPPPTKEEVDNSPYVKDYRKYQKDKAKYDVDIELYEQRKLIRFIKNADEKLILKKYKIFEISKIPTKANTNKVIFKGK